LLIGNSPKDTGRYRECVDWIASNDWTRRCRREGRDGALKVSIERRGGCREAPLCFVCQSLTVLRDSFRVPHGADLTWNVLSV
jgi:hypothetical protein